MKCADLEISLCDYVDGTLHGEQKSAVEAHLAVCPSCAELVRDAAGAVAFMQRAAVVDAPPELVTRILYELPAARRKESSSKSWWSRIKTGWLDPILQPRFAMSMAMTLVSFAMLARFTGVEIRQLKPADLNPVAVWANIEDKALRTWERGVKYYDSLRLVYEIQTRLKDWGDQADAETNTAGKTGTQKTGVSKEQSK